MSGLGPEWTPGERIRGSDGKPGTVAAVGDRTVSILWDDSPPGDLHIYDIRIATNHARPFTQETE